MGWQGQAASLYVASATWRAVVLWLAYCTHSATAQERVPPGFAIPSLEQVRAVRELADGRVIVVDGAQGGRLLVADFARGRVAPLANRGEGPGEYRALGRTIAIAGDTTLVADPGQDRWLVFVGSVPSPFSRGRAEFPSLFKAKPLGSDGRRVLFSVPPGRLSETGADSSALVWVEAKAPRDTVARLAFARRVPKVLERSSGGTAVAILLNSPLWVDEQALPFPDGWIAIARLNPYRVDWIDRQGRVILGPPLPVSKVRIDRTEMLFALDRFNGRGTILPIEPEAYPDWPADLPPFGESALLVLPDGRLAIRRLGSAQATRTTYDVVDRRGALSRTIELPLNQRIVAFGRNAAYLVTRDEDDIETLRRGALP